MIGGLLALAGAMVSVLAFPRFGPGWLILPGVALFLAGLKTARSRTRGFLYGALYGLAFFAGLIWWLFELGWLAVVPLVVVQAAYFALYGWWLARYNDRSSGEWLLLAVGGWGLMELIRYRFPVGGFEWGAAGYALSDQPWARAAAPLVGTTGITVGIVAVAAAAVLYLTGERRRWMLSIPLVLVALALGTWAWNLPGPGYSVAVDAVVVQGSTPCPFTHCQNERRRTFQQHLEMTRTIGPGSVDLVVWSEGSTGATNADPVQNPEIGAAVAAEARRISAWFLVGGDRPISDTHWINANVVFNPQGEVVGEYQKQHPVPFGEYIPWRPLFDWIPDLEQVPRDMIPGSGPEVFDLGRGIRLGSVISFEGGFARYPRQHAAAGANLIVVATNEGSYGTTPASDQFIGMTRMRAAELGSPLIHAAVTGRSVMVDESGAFVSELSGHGVMEMVAGTLYPDSRSIYLFIGDLVMLIAAALAVLTWWRVRRPLVVSDDRMHGEE